MNFSNWKIGHKLALAFAFLALVTAAVGGLAVVELRTIEAARTEVEGETTAVGTLRQARFYLARQENAFRGYLLSGDPYYIERLSAHRENFVKNLTESAESRPSTDVIKAGYSEARTAADAWYALVDAEADRIRGGADRAAAMAFVGRDGPSDAAIGPAEDAIDSLIDSKVEMRDVSNRLLKAAVDKARLYLIIGAAVSALAAAVIGLLMTRAIARPLSRLAHVMDRIVDNDTSVAIENVDRKDEIGAMSRAVQVFKDNALGLMETSAQMGAAKRSQAVIEFALDGTVLDANQNFLDVMGYSLPEIQGRNHKMFVTSEFAASAGYGAMWQKLRSGEPVVDKFHRVGKDGRKVIIDAFYTPIPGPDGLPAKVMKFASNVTESETARENDANAQAVVVGETGRGLAALAAGDLSFRIESTFPGEYAKLQTDFNAAMTALEEAMGVIGSNASAMQSGAGEISQAADDLSRRTEQQAATLEETAAALDEITATVKRTAQGAEQAGTVVVGAKAAAEQSGVVVGRAVAAMGEIERSSDQISQIIGVIDEIAFQTNLLALNAGVEAARAGDAGRGFAVVASEVRALAQRSAEAAKEIKSLIATSRGHVKDGVGLVGETGEALTAIVERVSEINGLMAEITASAQEQATALSEVNTAVNQMDQTTQQNAAMVEQSTAASHNLSQEAEELAVLVGKFHVSANGGGAARTGRAKANPVRQAQARIADFARQSTPAPVRRMASGGAALAQSAEPVWEQF